MSEEASGNFLPRLVQAQQGVASASAMTVSPGVRGFCRVLEQVHLAIGRYRVEPAKKGSLAVSQKHFTHIYVMAVGLLRGDEGPPCAVHDQQLSHNLLQRPAQTGLDSNLPQDARDHGLFRAQLFLLFGQISQQQAHDQTGKSRA